MNALEFRAAMAALPEPPADARPPYWDYWRHDLWDRAQTDSVENFMKWPAVYHTMLVNHFPIGAQLGYLQSDWLRWEKVVSDPDSEPNQRNLINQACHLKIWEDTTGRHVDELGTILEFGGGYGALALAAHRLGFHGRYLVHDLPEFALLQRWWLGAHGMEVEHVTANDPADLFVGIYSLSEIPPTERRAWLGMASSYLLLYSSRFAEYDNAEWGRQMVSEIASENVDFDWQITQFAGRPDWYAIGWKK